MPQAYFYFTTFYLIDNMDLFQVDFLHLYKNLETPHISPKIEEGRLLCGQVETNNLIYGVQHGFCSGKSVISTIIDFVEAITKSEYKGKKLVSIFMHFSKNCLKSIDI